MERHRLTAPPIAIIVAGALFLNGCHTTVPVVLPDSTPAPANSAVFSALKGGDTVRITLRDGKKVSLTVAEVRPDGLVGADGQQVAYDKMMQVEVSRPSRARTTWLIVGIAGGVALAILIAYAFAVVEVITP